LSKPDFCDLNKNILKLNVSPRRVCHVRCCQKVQSSDGRQVPGLETKGRLSIKGGWVNRLRNKVVITSVKYFEVNWLSHFAHHVAVDHYWRYTFNQKSSVTPTPKTVSIASEHRITVLKTVSAIFNTVS
jgi:hypothetical protein